ncbi:MAG: 5'-3' exonuclease [Halioglobus sp.]
MTGERRAWLLDASIYIFRAWFSMPDRWYTHEGMPVQAVYGYARFLLDFVASRGAHFHGAAAFDESLGSNFRNDIYPAYKSSRELPDDTLALQLQACRDITELLGIRCYGGPRYEADDYLATLARLYQRDGLPVTLVTRDKDLGQLMSGAGDRWWDYAGDVLLDPAAFAEKFGVTPAQFADYLALVGDPVDDIPGVPGVGAKTAAALLQVYGSLEHLGQNLDDIPARGFRGGAGLAQRLQEHWPQVLIARQLTGLEKNVPGLRSAPEFQLDASNLAALAAYLDELNLGGPLTRRCAELASKVAQPC